MIPALTWSAVWRWFKEFWWVVLALALAALGIYIDRRARHQQHEKDQQDYERAQLDEQASVDATLRTIEQENQTHAEAADRDVRDMPMYLPDELRERRADIAEIVLGNRRRDGE